MRRPADDVCHGCRSRFAPAGGRRPCCDRASRMEPVAVGAEQGADCWSARVQVRERMRSARCGFVAFEGWCLRRAARRSLGRRLEARVLWRDYAA